MVWREYGRAGHTKEKMRLLPKRKLSTARPVQDRKSRADASKRASLSTNTALLTLVFFEIFVAICCSS